VTKRLAVLDFDPQSGALAQGTRFEPTEGTYQARALDYLPPGDFAKPNRELLRIPPDIPFRVRPRLDTSKTYYFRGGVKKPIQECEAFAVAA